MAFHKIPLVEHHKADHIDSEDAASHSSEDDDDDNWDDWNSDPQTQCLSLFEEREFQSASAAMMYDKDKYGFDLDAICRKLSLDFYGRTRLINFIRKEKPSPSELTNISGKEAIFTSNTYLKPVIEDDPLLQFESNDWSEEEEEVSNSRANTDESTRNRGRIVLLEKKLAQALQELGDYRRLVEDRLEISDIDLIDDENDPAQSSSKLQPEAKEDDGHYFDSYDEHEIHAVMIQDKVRTATYASFILSNPSLFQDAIVLDVGCGTGILSLFAARAGARRVLAVDASDIAEKAEKIVKANDLEGVITVIRGKVEEVRLPDDIDHVDIIVSEWMGYTLLYESMLDSVIHARDRFLSPDTGVMVPSQCRMMLSLCNASEIFKERIGFWSDVYGFDLSPMADDVYNDAIVDVVGPDNLLSEPVVIKDLHLKTITSKQLDFTSSFTLTCNAARRTSGHAFLLYFDTFFTTDGKPIPPETAVRVVKDEEAMLAEVWRVGGEQKPRRSLSRRVSEKQLEDREKQKVKKSLMSFTTGPQSVPTHWKQTLFLLREPLSLEEGTIISGTITFRKNEENSRELDVELRYAMEGKERDDLMTVQIYKVR